MTMKPQLVYVSLSNCKLVKRIMLYSELAKTKQANFEFRC